MKYPLIVLLMLVSIKSSAQEPLTILGTESPFNDVIVKIDLSRVCSHPTDNNPNFYFKINENTIELRISITHSVDIICDPPPPNAQSFMYINLGNLNSGDYELNIFFVDSDESVITGTPFQMFPYIETVNFQVAAINVIPALSITSLIFMLFIMFVIGIRKLHNTRIKL